MRRKLWPDAAVVGAVGAFALSLYILTLPPSLTWAYGGADGGELATAVYTLGVAHPPGYPTYVLLGKGASLLLPFGDQAHRLALFSAIAGAATAGLFSLVTLHLLRRLRPEENEAVHIGGAVLAGTGLAASPLFWSQAIIVEVYALHALFVSLVLAGLARWRWLRSRGRRAGPTLVGVAFLVGVGAGNHLTLLFLLPALVPLLAGQVRRQELLWALVALAGGLSIYLALPVLALRDPSIAWGDPRTFGDWLWVVTGRLYQDRLFGLEPQELPGRLGALLALAARQLGGAGWVVALVGVVGLWGLDRRLALSTMLLAALFTVYAVWYDSADSYVYLLPLLMAAALWLGVGAIALAREAASLTPRFPGVGKKGVLLLLLLLPFLSVAWNYRSVDLLGDRTVQEYIAQAVSGIELDAVIVADTDPHVFSLWYWRYVQEPESTVDVVAEGLLEYPWYQRQLLRRSPGLLPAGALSGGAGLIGLLDVNVGKRPVYLTDPDLSVAERYRLDLVPGTLRYRVILREG